MGTLPDGDFNSSDYAKVQVGVSRHPESSLTSHQNFNEGTEGQISVMQPHSKFQKGNSGQIK
eukprot:scaffold677210_cov45-Prasinocladus_malaysianus.AAC.1